MRQAACLQLFARLPVPGAVKTRLIPALGELGACELHARLVATRLALLQSCQQSLGMDVEWWVDADGRHPLLERFAGRIRRQQGGDLGARMQYALAAALGSDGYAAALLIGSDCPALGLDYITQALARLQDGADVVLGPAYDGGYVLIGLAAQAFVQERCDIACLFRGIAWGTDGVLEQTLCHIRDAGLSCSLLPALPDVDRPEDLQYVPGQDELKQQ